MVSGDLKLANLKGVDLLSMKIINLQGVETFHLSDFCLLDDARCTGWFGKKSMGNLTIDSNIGPEDVFVVHARLSQRDSEELEELEAEKVSMSKAENWFLDTHKLVINEEVGHLGLLRWRAIGFAHDTQVSGFTTVELSR